VPLYGTVVSGVPIDDMNSMPQRCEAEPMPALATVTVSLCALAYSTSSGIDFASKSPRATKVIGTSVTRPMPAKSSPGL
jgi:hypothetical protein